MDLYENVFIGSFIYALGLEAGRRGVRMPASINLLQQTPLDKTMGDVLADFNGKVRILEFKRQSNRSLKEEEKRQRLEESIRSKTLRATSLVAHRYVESYSDGERMNIDISPYLLFHLDRERTGLTELINEVLDADRENEPGTMALQSYIEHLQETFSDGTHSGSGGLVICASEDGISCTVLSDISDLCLTASAIMEMSASRAATRTFRG